MADLAGTVRYLFRVTLLIKVRVTLGTQMAGGFGVNGIPVIAVASILCLIIGRMRRDEVVAPSTGGN